MNVETVRPNSNSTHGVEFWNIGWLTGRNGALKSTDVKKLVSRFMRYLTRLNFYNLHCCQDFLTPWISFLGKSSEVCRRNGRSDMKIVHWTSKDLQVLPEDEGTRYEIIDGELYVSKQPHKHHQLVCARIWTILQTWSIQTDNGEAVAAPGL